MNRIIKFRAWDEKNMLMVKDLSMFNHGKGGRWIVLADELENEVMQFTGLLDKNGKEIYEGDILSNEHNVKWIVQWNEDEARFTNVAYFAKNREVVGNVMENPELLK